MNYSNLRSKILDAIKYPPKISAASLQEQLINIVNGLDLGALLLGVATPSLAPNTEANGFYFALQSGTYTNFPTINGQTITVDSSEVAIIVRSGNYWSKIHITTYPTIDPTTKHWMIGNEDTGVLAEGTTPHIDQETGNWMIGTYDTGIHAQGAPGKDAYQPFKGTFASVQDLNAAYPEPNDGDTAYVSVTVDSTTELHVYDVESGAWHDTGTTADSPVFGSGQFLSSVKIDDTQLANPSDGSLPKAGDVMQLKAKLEGVTASEEKVQLISSDEGQNVFAGKVVGATGVIDHSGSNDVNYKYVEFEIPSNVKSIRFMTPSGTGWTAGWAIGHYSEGNFVKDRSSAYISGKEFTVEVKEGETHFRTNCYMMYGTTPTNRLLNFYCYLQSGTNVGEELKGKVNVADMSEYASIVKNLFDKDIFITGRYVTSVISSWTSNANGIMSQPLFLNDGAEYTVSNVCMRYYPNGSTSTTGSDPEHAQVLLVRFDENDNPIDIQSYPAVEDVVSGGGYCRNRGHATFTFNKGNEHHCRFLVNANVQWSASSLQDVQLEVGNQVTSYAQYGEVVAYDLAKKIRTQ
ncbi:MAG: hypothetical protein IJQ83_07245 [Bacteroidales bacterium]|nr:hypothetical protein [Bacteroidales bacterium]